jgi:anthrone oxygenase-like protein
VTVLLAVQGIAVFAAGLIAGILFGDRAGNSYARPKLPAAAFLAFQREQNRRLAAMMPLPILAAVVASFAWLLLVRSRAGAPDFVLIAAGTGCLLVFVAITRMVNIPINRRVDAGDAARWPRWERAHTVRTVFAVLAFLCELAALALSRGATP